MASDEEVIENKIKPILEKLTAHILKNRPENIPLYMIEYLQKVGNITTSGLTYDEKHELESLRKQVQQYRQIEAHVKIITIMMMNLNRQLEILKKMM